MQEAQSDENELRIPLRWRRSTSAGMAAEDVARALRGWTVGEQRAAARALVFLNGSEALPQLLLLAGGGTWGDATVRQATAEAMSVIPTDEAFEALLTEATQSRAETQTKWQRAEAVKRARPFLVGMSDAVARFPGRAVRLLAARSLEDGCAEAVGGWLAAAVASDLVRAESLSATLSPEARARVVSLVERFRDRRDALPEDLPAVLREPPWERVRAAIARRQVPEIPTLGIDESVVFWGNERARFAELDLDARLEAYLPPEIMGDLWAFAQDSRRDELGPLLLALPLEQACELAEEWKPDPGSYSPTGLVTAVVERLGVHVITPAIRFARAVPKAGYMPLRPLRSPRIAPIIAHGFLRKRSTRVHAERWLRRHPEAAAVGLIPVAFGKDEREAEEAIEALRWLVRRGFVETVLHVAERYALSSEVAELVVEDELGRAPKKLPPIPAFADVAALPVLELRDGGGTLPPDAARALVMLLAISEAGDPHAGLLQVREACTASSLARFGWALFDSWVRAGSEPKHRWALQQLAWLGGDDVAHELSSRMQRWPKEGAHQRAVLGLEVLAEMPGEIALSLVHAIAETSRAKGLKRAAERKLFEVAERRGLGEEELLDRLVPRLGLDHDGRIRFDFGPRSFVVGLDVCLRPYVLDDTGRRRRTLPKAAKHDDADLAATSVGHFTQLKKDVRRTAKTLLARLERAMVEGRYWSLDDFTSHVLRHPLVVSIARGLIFRTEDGTSFRIDDSGGCVDGDDDVLSLGSGDRVQIAHPVDMGPAERSLWRSRFADYELIQPFPQLAREVFFSGTHEVDFSRLRKAELEPGAILGLKSKGWVVPDENDDGIIGYLTRRLPDDIMAHIEIDPGIVIYQPATSGRQALRCLSLERGALENVPIDWLTPISYSEVMRDLMSLTAS